MRVEGKSLIEIGRTINASEGRVSQILAEARADFNKDPKQAKLIEAMRNEAAVRQLAIIKSWFPMAVQPTREQEVHKIIDGKSQVVKEQVFNEPGLRAADLVLKAEEKLAKLMGMNIEQGDGIDEIFKDRNAFFVWISQQAAVTPVQQGKVIEMKESFGLLEVTKGEEAV